jgi:hypothetical protein
VRWSLPHIASHVKKLVRDEKRKACSLPGESYTVPLQSSELDEKHHPQLRYLTVSYGSQAQLLTSASKSARSARVFSTSSGVNIYRA